MWHTTRLYWSCCRGLHHRSAAIPHSSLALAACRLLRRGPRVRHGALCSNVAACCEARRRCSTYTAPAPTEEEVRKAFRVLGVQTTSSQAEVKKRYLALAKEHHPDVATGANAAANTSRMMDINDAYQTVNRFHKSGQSLSQDATASSSSSAYYYYTPQDDPFGFYAARPGTSSYGGPAYQPWYEEIDPIMYEMLWEEMRQRSATMADGPAGLHGNDDGDGHAAHQDEVNEENDGEEGSDYYEYVTRGGPYNAGGMHRWRGGARPPGSNNNNTYESRNRTPRQARVRWERRQGKRAQSVSRQAQATYGHTSAYTNNNNTNSSSSCGSSNGAASTTVKETTSAQAATTSEAPSSQQQQQQQPGQTSGTQGPAGTSQADTSKARDAAGWSDEDRQAMLHMYRDGKSFEFIAHALSKATSAVTEEFNRWCVRGGTTSNNGSGTRGNGYRRSADSQAYEHAAAPPHAARRRPWQAANNNNNNTSNGNDRKNKKSGKPGRPYARSYPYYTESPDEIPPELYAAMAADMDAYDLRRSRDYDYDYEEDDYDEDEYEDDERSARYDPYGYAVSEGGGYVPYNEAMPYNGHHFMSGQPAGRLYHEHKRGNNNCNNSNNIGSNGYRSGNKKKPRYAGQYGGQSFRPRYQDGSRRRR